MRCNSYGHCIQREHCKKEPTENLRGAGRYWVEGRKADPGGLQSDLAAFGIDAPDAASFISEDELDYSVLPENWEAVELFRRCATQWRHAGLAGVRTGLDYPSVESVMRMIGVKDFSDTFSRLQIIETGALEAMAEKRDS